MITVYYSINLITEKKTDENGVVLVKARVLNKYPICLATAHILKEHPSFLEALNREYLRELDPDTLERTWLYIREYAGVKWNEMKVPATEFVLPENKNE